ncbi:MAG: hypothetical protein GY942_25125 [Aestuariibacter sp.]|nr:hypothetical protein [Aestuariibacter sp.]
MVDAGVDGRLSCAKTSSVSTAGSGVVGFWAGLAAGWAMACFDRFDWVLLNKGAASELAVGSGTGCGGWA